MTDCSICDYIAKAIGAIQMTVSGLELTRYKWIEPNYITNKPFFDQVQLLMTLYIRLYALGFNIDNIWNSMLIQRLFYKLTQKFLDADFFKIIEKNVSENWFNSAVILMDIPGKTCESIGDRIGITIRRITGIKLDD